MAAKNSEYRMAIKIAGEIEKSLYNSTDLTRKELQKIAREAALASSITKQSFSQVLQETEPFFNGLEKAGVKAFKAVATGATAAGTAIIAIGTASANAGIQFESAFAGVKKTTDATTAEYAQMREEILAMTREIPASAVEISEVAEAAGQLGIQKDNLLEFTRTMIDLGESTNLSSTEAASSLAKFANITKMSADNYDELGSVIVDLGNNFATTEADVVAMATRLASAGELAGFSEAQIMAMSTAMSSVGIEAEAGGSAMSKFIKGIQVSVETGAKDLKDYAKVAGMSVEEFKQAFEKDGLSAASAFIGGLNDIERNGKSATVILDEMGLTEVRLSNTLLSLANAGDLMANAVETANKAWEENTALAKEAGTRYETTESKIAVMKNGITEFGIEINDQINGPMRDGIDIFSDLMHEATASIGSSNVISEIAQEIVDGVPTAIRVTKDLAGVIGDIADPFLAVGGWLADNPELLEGTIVGVGSALATYKVAKGISSLAGSFTALGVASLPILGLTGAAAVIGGVTVAVKKSAEDAKKANLDRHFGNITLSLSDLEETAAYIVDNDSLGQVRESIDALRELDGIDESIDDAVTELNRMNWKVSIGMNLKEDEQERYKQNIASYVDDVQAYVEQEQYSVNLAVGVLTDDDLEGANIVTRINEFYSDKQQELANLGTQLNAAITDAFTDGLLEPDEAKLISGLQQQMANIKASLTEGQYEANLDLLGLKYSTQELDSDSFQNLQAEINEQMEQARKDYEEAYTLANASARARFADPESKMTQAEYDAELAEYKENYLEQVGSLEAKATSFMGQSIRQHYEDEAGGYIDNMPDAVGRATDRIKNMETLPNSDMQYQILAQEAGLDGIDSTTKKAIGELWKEYKPGVEELQKLQQEYIDAGKAIPQYITDGINEGLAIGLLSKDKSMIFDALGQQAISQNYEPTAVDEEKVSEAAEEAYAAIKAGYTDKFSDPIEMEAWVKIYTNNQFTNPNSPRMKAYGYGGFATYPQNALIAERGYDEALIPIDGSERSKSLWEETGERLGISGREGSFSVLMTKILGDEGSGTSNTTNNNDESYSFPFSPVYNFYGEAPSQKDMDNHVEASFEKWEAMMEKWQKNHRRLSFS